MPSPKLQPYSVKYPVLAPTTLGLDNNDPLDTLPSLPATSKLSKFSQMLSKKVINTTHQSWSYKTKGKFNIPTATQLRTKKHTFGPPSLLHSFHCEPDIFNIAIFIIKILG